jgi:siderophore synthetase component
MRLTEVRRWARARGFSEATFRRIYAAALLHVISRLLQAIHRESRVTRLSRVASDRWYLEIGAEPVLRMRVSGPLPFGRLELLAAPCAIESGKRRRIHTAAAFLSVLRRCLAASEYGPVLNELCSDFENSVANVVFNRLVGRSLPKNTIAPEPAYQGHQYYPFPALRIGPSLSQIVECSHLRAAPVPVRLLQIRGSRFISGAFASYEACIRTCTGLQLNMHDRALLPLHPWHSQLSPIVRDLVDRKMAAFSAETVHAIPLASQRTCRVIATGFDLKLPVNATLTGERRLLYRLHCENAPVISLLARATLELADAAHIDFQDDLASVFHVHEAISPHLSAIFRAPVRPRPGEVLIPAIDLWAGRHRAKGLLSGAERPRIEEFFARYSRALMAGPVQFCVQWGMAFEPHLQNVYVGLRGGLPTRVVLRDLDATILEPHRVRRALREHGLEIAPGTWRYMPSYEIGGMRLVQAMLFGHLGEVMWWLHERAGADVQKLALIVEDTWSDLAAGAPCASARAAVKKLQGWSDSVKATLHTRLHRSSRMQFVRKSNLP